MPSARRLSVASVLALSLFAGALPARSDPTTIVGTLKNQPGVPIPIDSCTAVLDGTTYTPQIALVSDPRVAIVQSFGLTFLDANGKELGEADVSPPFEAATAPGGAFSAMRCEVRDERLDDGSDYTDRPKQHDPHAFTNVFIGIGILAAVGFLASRNTNGGSSSTDTSATTTPVTTTTASAGSTSTPDGTVTPVLLLQTAAPRVTPSPSPTATATARAGTTSRR